MRYYAYTTIPIEKDRRWAKKQVKEGKIKWWEMDGIMCEIGGKHYRHWAMDNFDSHKDFLRWFKEKDEKEKNRLLRQSYERRYGRWEELMDKYEKNNFDMFPELEGYLKYEKNKENNK